MSNCPTSDYSTSPETMDSASLRLFWIVVIALLAAMMVLTIQRNDVWASEMSLWKDAVAKSPRLPGAHINLAREYQLIGNLPAAVREYQAAANLAYERQGENGRNREMLVLAQSNLGMLMLQGGDLRAAEGTFRSTLSLWPHFGPAVLGLSEVLNREERYAETLTVIDQALQANEFGGGFTALGRLYVNRGMALCSLGFEQPANDSFQYAAAIDPDLAVPGSRRAKVQCQ